MEIAITYQALIDTGVMYDEWLDRGLSAKGHGAGAALARLLRISPVKVTKMRKGEREPRAHELPIIEEFLGTPAPIGKPPAVATQIQTHSVHVVGYVGAGSQAHYYAVAQGSLDEVPAPLGANHKTVAVEIRGDSLGSIFDRWLVFYDDVRTPVTDDLIGKLCVIGLPNDQILVKKLRRGKGGTYDLHSERGEPIRGVRPEWAARVRIMTPR